MQATYLSEVFWGGCGSKAYFQYGLEELQGHLVGELGQMGNLGSILAGLGGHHVRFGSGR